MPNTFHRLYKWHITHKMGDKVGQVYQDHDAMNKFHEILNNTKNVEVFEESWHQWLVHNNLVENAWLKEITRYEEGGALYI